MENRRAFLDDVKMKYQIKEPSEWGKITIQDIRELGGGSFLSYYYNNSMFRCLTSVYPGFHLFLMF